MHKASNKASKVCLNISDGDLNLNTGFNGDRRDLLHHFRWAVQVNHTLVHTQLKPVPCVGSWESIKDNPHQYFRTQRACKSSHSYPQLYNALILKCPEVLH